MAACRVQGFIGNGEKAVEFRFDNRHEASFGTEFAEQLANNPRAFGAKALNLPAERDIANDPSGTLAAWTRRTQAEPMAAQDRPAGLNAAGSASVGDWGLRLGGRASIFVIANVRVRKADCGFRAARFLAERRFTIGGAGHAAAGSAVVADLAP